MKRTLISTIIASIVVASTPAQAIVSPSNYEGKPATAFTIEKNAEVKNSLPFSDTSDFDDVRRGFIADLKTGEILGKDGRSVYSTNDFSFLPFN